MRPCLAGILGAGRRFWRDSREILPACQGERFMLKEQWIEGFVASSGREEC
jgi:hypothetical protein